MAKLITPKMLLSVGVMSIAMCFSMSSALASASYTYKTIYCANGSKKPITIKWIYDGQSCDVDGIRKARTFDATQDYTLENIPVSKKTETLSVCMASSTTGPWNLYSSILPGTSDDGGITCYSNKSGNFECFSGAKNLASVCKS